MNRETQNIVYRAVTKAVCFLMFAMSCYAVHAQDSTTKLSLADAISRALGINTSIIQAEDSRQSSLSRLRIANLKTNYGLGARTGLAHSSTDSSLSSRAFYNLSFEDLTGTQASLELAPFGIGSERGNVSLTIRHPLMAGSGLLSRKAEALAGARSDATSQEKQLYLTRQTLVLSVVRAYYSAVLSRDQVKVQENAVKVSEEVADGARRRAEAGLVPEIDVSRADIRVAQTKDQLNLKSQSAQAAEDQLMTTIGAGIGDSIELIDSVPTETIEIPLLADAVKSALANRTELSVFDQRLADQERNLAIAKDALRPKMDAVVGFSSSNDDSGLLSGSLFGVGNFNAGLEYTLPLDKRVEQENHDNAARALDILRKMRAFNMEEIVEQVRNAYRDVATTKTSVEILTQNVKDAQDNLKLAQRMVDEGLDDNRNVLDAQEALTQAESGLLSAKIDLHIASINLKYAMGEDLTYLAAK